VAVEQIAAVRDLQDVGVLLERFQAEAGAVWDVRLDQ
jgi:hypothetical protein